MECDKSISFVICLCVGLKIRVKKVAGVAIRCIFVALLGLNQNQHRMRSFIIFLLTFSVSGICISQKAKSNTCTATLTQDPIMETVEKIHYIFTGSDTTGLNVKLTTITVLEGQKALVKKKKKDCDSPKPEDCIEETLEDFPPITMNLFTLAGPDVTKEYETRKEKVKVVKKEGGTVKENVVCAKNRSSKLIKRIQAALISLGYPLTENGILDQATNLSVTDFQKSKGLAYGDLSLSTLAALGIK